MHPGFLKPTRLALITCLGIVLTLVGQRGTAAQTKHTVAGVLPSGYGCTTTPNIGDYAILVEFTAAGQPPTKGKVQFTQRIPYPNQSAPVCGSNGRATGDDGFKMQTANNLQTFKIEKFDGVELVISSPGACGKPLKTGGTIHATITRNSDISVSCSIDGASYSYSGKGQPALNFK